MSHYTRKDSRITYIREKAPLTVGAARNRTISENPHFPIIAYHDVDDIMMSDRLKLSIKGLSNSHVVYGNAKCFGLRHDISYSFPYMNFKILFQKNRVHASTTCFRREVWRCVNGFDESMYRGSDYDFWLRIAKVGFKFEYLNQILTLHRIHSKSITQHESRFIKFPRSIHILVVGEKTPADIYAKKKHPTEHRDTKTVIILLLLSFLWRKYSSITGRGRILNDYEHILKIEERCVQRR